MHARKVLLELKKRFYSKQFSVSDTLCSRIVLIHYGLNCIIYQSAVQKLWNWWTCCGSL